MLVANCHDYWIWAKTHYSNRSVTVAHLEKEFALSRAAKRRLRKKRYEWGRNEIWAKETKGPAIWPFVYWVFPLRKLMLAFIIVISNQMGGERSSIWHYSHREVFGWAPSRLKSALSNWLAFSQIRCRRPAKETAPFDWNSQEVSNQIIVRLITRSGPNIEPQYKWTSNGSSVVTKLI